MRAEMIEQVKEMIRKTTGIIIHTENTGDVSVLLAERLQALQLDENDYPRYLESIPDEMVRIASRFTVQETSFYRYRQHFDRLKLQVLPDLIRRKQARHDRRILIVSAGCATGEEPYTIAMIVHDLLKDQEGWEVRIETTDINAEALRLARAGVYSNYRLRNIDPWYLYRYFDAVEARGSQTLYRLKVFIKNMVTFRQANLIGEPFPLADLAGADIIFCENVIIYFCMESIQKLIDRFYGLLAPEGFLFLGHSETLNIINHRFELSWWNDSFAYRKSAAPDTATEQGRPRSPLLHQPPTVTNAAQDIPFPELMYLLLQSFESEAYDTAAALLRQAEKSGAGLTDIYHLIKAEFLFQNQQHMPAANACRQAIGLNQKSAEAHLLLGAIYLDLGMLGNAQFEINTALYHEPESALGYYYLGRYYHQTGNPTESAYCLGYAKHLLEAKGNVIPGKTFPFYRTRRAEIYTAIQNAVSHPAGPSRSGDMNNGKEREHGR